MSTSGFAFSCGQISFSSSTSLGENRRLARTRNLLGSQLLDHRDYFLLVGGLRGLIGETKLLLQAGVLLRRARSAMTGTSFCWLAKVTWRATEAWIPTGGGPGFSGAARSLIAAAGPSPGSSAAV